MQNAMRLKLEWLGGSAIATLALLIGISYTNPSGFRNIALASLGGAVTAAAATLSLCAINDRTGVLQREISRLEIEVKSLKAKLDKEYEDAIALIAICEQLQDAVSKHEFELSESSSKVIAIEQQAQQWQLAAHNSRNAALNLKAQLEQLQADFDERLHQAVKAKANRIARRNADMYISKRKEELTEINTAHLEQLQSIKEGYQKELEELQTLLGQREQQLSEFAIEIKTWDEEIMPGTRSAFTESATSLQLQLQLAAQRLEALQNANAQLQAPRLFPGTTAIDTTGNRIVQHFAAYEVILDAVEAILIPTGFRLRFKCDRTNEFTKLTEEEFDKRTAEPGLMGLSYAPLDFALDTRNFIVSVDIVTSPPLVTGGGGAIASNGKPITAAAATDLVSNGSASSEDAFRALGCFPASEFENVIRDKFVPRVRVVAGSTGGKSPLMELIAVALAKQNQAELWLINPVPGSPKDWFSVPGLVQPGTDVTQEAIAQLQKAHRELNERNKNLSQKYRFLIVCADEINRLAREFADLGTVIKDYYQISDHAQMGFITAGQGGNVSGVSGAAKTDNAKKLMEEDFQNATQVFTAQAAKVWLQKKSASLLPKLTELEALCRQLNEAAGLSPRPKPGTKVVDRHAYRVALVVSPATDEPFFLQIPPYSHYADKLEGISFPNGAIITAPYENQVALGLASDPLTCPHCGSAHTKQDRPLKTEIKRKCNDCGHFYKVPKPTLAASRKVFSIDARG
ncbi:hypothetical protein HY772_04340 [Candidatus Woesearchaeota archaeon]|nr:hypothetical protein [Candidatus Woesearchaeota archaeon]